MAKTKIARGGNKKSLPRDMKKQIGKTGESFIQNYLNEEKRVDDLSIQDYRRMVDNDGQVQMLINAIFNTILSAGFQIQDDDSIDSEEPSEEQQFIEANLTNPTWKDGMSIDLDLTNRRMLRAFIEGYRLFEVVYRQGDDGRIYLDKLSPRAGKDDREMIIKVDPKTGEFIGFHQITQFMNAMVDVEVVNTSDVSKVVKATYGEEYGSHYGRSGLKAAWYHYDKGHKGLYLLHVGGELGAVKFRNLKHNIQDETKIADTVQALEKVGLEAVFAANQNEMELFFESVSDASVLDVIKETVNFHYSAIAKSLLAQFVDLGSNTSDSGSRALGESQITFFKEGLQAIGHILIEKTWNKVIADLCKVNFGTGIYPTYKINSLDNTSQELIYEAFMEIVKKGNLSDSIAKELQLLASDKLGLDVTEEQIIEDEEKKVQEEQQKFQQEQDLMKMKVANTPQKPIQMSDHVEDISPALPVYPDQERVKFNDIEFKLKTSKRNAEDILFVTTQNQKNRIVEDYLEAIRKGKVGIRRQSIDLAENNDYRNQLKLITADLMEYGKVSVANELDKPVPETTSSQRSTINGEVDLAVDKQESDLEFRMKTVSNSALNSGIPEQESRKLLEEEYDDFFSTLLTATIAALIPRAFNFGRDITAQKYKVDIYAARYTATFENTCAYCAGLHGNTVQLTDPDYSLIDPPNHFNCNCFWTYIPIEDSEGIIITGKPDDIPIYSSLSTYEDIDMSETEKRIDKYIDHVH